MDTNLIEKVTSEYKKVKHPDFKVGDIIEVHTKIKEGDKERVQVFKGIVIAMKGSGISKTFTVRKISYGVGVEKIFPLYAPGIAKIKIVKKGNVRRSKLYYLRERIGKAALKAGGQVSAEGEDLETKFKEEEVEKKEEAVDEEKEKEKETKDSKSERGKEVEEAEKPKEEKKVEKDEKLEEKK